MKKYWIIINSIYDRLLLIFLVIVLLISTYSVYDTWFILDKASDNSEILKYKPGLTLGEILDGDPEILENMKAWITIDNTNIDYPVMQGTDNTVYLNTDPFGQYSLSGSIFLDSRNKPDFSEEYSLIYGHHLQYGIMFGALDSFLDADYLKSHTSGTLTVITGSRQEPYKLEIFASATVNAKNKTVFEFDNSEQSIREFIKSNAKVYTTDRDNRILALSTCAEGASLSRVVVFCYII